MIFEKKEVVLKNGASCILRSPLIEDAESMIDYLKTTSAETEFMVRYSEEVTMTIEEEGSILKRMIDSENSIMIAAFVENELAGNASISCVGERIKLSHRATFGIAVKQKFWGMGIGDILLSEIIGKAKEIGFEQVELTVVENNNKAINLYEKFGFVKCGVIHKAFKLKDGRYYGEIIMIKSL
ncbi:GNAT family N-acetyltransferase [Sedimentibacter hydroxybenzoicus DSM 7310]|uniref:GNAT family N-acetyltransferase n=1 Tax=Sedimentibacter hydroxybenzoicus DSM 7310 TaxID=1123245 RepID=A0A974BLH3_SEDHY|nr:GNAT family N-acetyltransferase [Sedimentibacter hydroxybenzoicus]NYB75363.1 GNAT family N-acetyltransferase [Sedimentibacter hydroxybenzoicus DSM 7310]